MVFELSPQLGRPDTSLLSDKKNKQALLQSGHEPEIEIYGTDAEAAG